ncbi:hypothetical protein [Kitasatospora sp. NPDC057223]|uniref:hypothetical protein n=1 Tax=Kitasatospora sp. NPDC057223 TaxID=3346055 RepID=UPI00363B912A
MMRESGSRPQDPDDLYAGQEAFSRRTIAEVDFPVYGVERAAQPAGALRVGPARTDGSTPPQAGTHLDSGPVDSDALAAFESCNGELSWVEVRSGDWTSVEGPYVSVRTYRPGAERIEALPELEDVVEDERDRVYEQLGIDEGDGPGKVRALREWITVEGEPRAVQIHEDRRPESAADREPGAVWAGRLRVDGLTVTVCGRGVPPGGVELTRIEDFERYILGRTDLMRQLAARRGRQVPVEERELAPVAGLEAHRVLVEHSIAESLAIEAQVRARRTPRLPRRLRGDTGAVRWEAAVRQQMKLASETREEAGEAVTAMVNHLNRLAQNTDWVVGTPDGRDAVEEVIRYTVFASEVSSLPAQRAWEQLWTGRPPGGADDEERSTGSVRRLGEQVWLSAWEQWRLERSVR